MGALPTGTVTFLFTDIEGSTRLLEEAPDTYPELLRAHHDIIRKAVSAHEGAEISTDGDAFFVAFPAAPNAVAAATAAQQVLTEHDWPGGRPVRVRMGLHSGEGELGGDDYTGLDVHRAARVAGAAHGGQVLLSEATRSLTQDHLPEGTSIRDLGQHRLKDLSRREHLYQLDIEGLEASFPALHTLDATPNNLPVYLTSFIGREKEIEELSLLIRNNRLVTLRGPGGVGKTRLATRAAATVLEEFPDGVWMTDLSATDDPDLVPTLVADSLGVRDISGVTGRPISEVLADYLVDKELLLLLDNCEHVLGSSSELTATLLRRTEQVHIVATSRDSLAVPGTQFTVPSLAHEDDGASDSEAVRLFVARALQANPDFPTDGPEIAPVEEITRRVDGLPLAIELAAARSNVLTPKQILDRLEDRFSLLKGGGTEAPRRHETLQATMDWSYDLLTDPEREALRLLSVFTGWTLEAAEAVLGADAVDLLANLTDRSLVEVSIEGADSRYRLLETVRQYAHDRLGESGREEAAQAAHADYYLSLVEAGDRGLRGPEQADWIERFKADHDNVRSAIAWALDTGNHDLALRLVSAMSWYWFIDGYWQGPLQMFPKVYEESVDGDQLLRARAVYKAGGIAVIWGWFADMAPLVEDAYPVLLELGDEVDIAYIKHFMGNIEASRGEQDHAEELLEEAIRMFDDMGDDWGYAFARRWMGSAVEFSGDPIRTIQHARASVAAFIDLGDRWAASWIAFVLGFNLVAIGELDEAQETLERSLELVPGTEDRLVLPHAKRGLAVVAARTGRPDLARSIFDEALPLHRRIGDENCIAICHMLLGELDTDAGDYSAAHDHLRRSLRGFVLLGNQLEIAPTIRRTADLAAAEGDYRRAAVLQGGAESIRESAGGVMTVHDRARFDETAAKSEAALGADEFARLVEEGTAMNSDAVIDYARST